MRLGVDGRGLVKGKAFLGCNGRVVEPLILLWWYLQCVSNPRFTSSFFSTTSAN